MHFLPQARKKTYNQIKSSRNRPFQRQSSSLGSMVSGQKHSRGKKTVHKLFLLIFHNYFKIKMSHSIHSLSIQIDTKNLKIGISPRFNSIKLSFIASRVKRVFHCIHTSHRCCTDFRYL